MNRSAHRSERLVAVLLVGLAGCSTVAPEARSRERAGERTQALQLTQEAKLTAVGGDEDHFGSSVSISGDTALVGAWDTSEPGAAYVFVRSGETWSQQAKLAPSDGVPHDSFGYSVSISGETAVVSAVGKGNETFAAYVFARSGGVWSQQARLTVNGDESFTHDWPAAVAISEDTVIAGKEWSAGPAAREAYVFARSGGTWSQQATLTSTEPGDSFGSAMSISGETAVIAAPGAHGGHGRVYAFTRSGGTWSEEAFFGTSDEFSKFTGFGRAVAVSGNTAVVGAPGGNSYKGAAYVLARTANGWSHEMKLVPSVAEEGDSFGQSVAIAGDLIIVGGRKAAPGAAWLFSRSGAYWTQQQVLSASDVGAGAFYGLSVGISGGTAVVGSSFASNEVDGSGAAYVYATKAPELGAPCLSASHCESGYCVDGVCCNTPCGGDSMTDCHVCSEAAGAAEDGVCGPLPSGASCDDGNACTLEDTCVAGGACSPGNAVVCTAPDECHESGSCSSATGACSSPMKAEGTPCSVGICHAGACATVPDAGPDAFEEPDAEAGAGGSTGSAGDSGAGGQAGSGGVGGKGGSAGAGAAGSPGAGEDAGYTVTGTQTHGGGCGCATSGSRGSLAWLMVIGVVALRRRAGCKREGVACE